MNCPELHFDCDELCSYRKGDKCCSPYWEEPKSIYDLMTHEELVRYLQTNGLPPIEVKHIYVYETYDKRKTKQYKKYIS